MFFRIPLNFQQHAVHIFKSLFSCRIRDLEVQTLADPFLLTGKKSGQVFKCQVLNHWNDKKKRYIDKCLSRCEQSCETSKYIAVKSIRISMKAMSEIITNYPSLKIIHLIRDPRATMYAQSQFGVIHMKQLDRDASIFCSRVQADVEEAEKISARAGKRVIRILYEDLAKDPIKTAQEIYRFIGEKFSSAVKDFVIKLTQSGLPENGVSGVIRPNSEEHVYKWRTLIRYHSVKTIDEKCRHLYRKLGIASVTSESMLRNISLPLWKSRV